MPKKKNNLPKGRKPTNEHQKMKYKLHFAKATQNKFRKIHKHLKKHPNDLQSLKSIDNQ